MQRIIVAAVSLLILAVASVPVYGVRASRREMGISVVAGQTLLIGWLLVEHRQRRRAEREAHEHLAKARQQLVAMTHLDRRAAIGEVTAAIIHELTQPIEAILHNAEAGQCRSYPRGVRSGSRSERPPNHPWGSSSARSHVTRL